MSELGNSMLDNSDNPSENKKLGQNKANFMKGNYQNVNWYD